MQIGVSTPVTSPRFTLSAAKGQPWHPIFLVAGKTDLPVLSYPRFKGDESPKPPETPANEEKESFLQRSFALTKVVLRKCTNCKEFKKSVRQGYQDSKKDLKETFQSGSSSKIAKRVGWEALGIVILIVCSPLPAPNPGWFVSPTARIFLKGFIKEDEPPKPPNTP